MSLCLADGSPITLGKLFSDSDLTADNLSLDALGQATFMSLDPFVLCVIYF